MKSDIVISLLTTLVGLAWTLFFLHLNNIGGVFEGGLIGGVGLTLFGVALSNTERKLTMSTNAEQRLQQQVDELMIRLAASKEARKKAETEAKFNQAKFEGIAQATAQITQNLNGWKQRAEAAEARITASQEQELWTALTKSGQIQVGDEVRFLLPSGIIEAVAHEVLYAGTDKEEVVYNRKKNHYFITSMAIDGTSSHKDVAFRRKQPLIPPEVADLQREIERLQEESNRLHLVAVSARQELLHETRKYDEATEELRKKLHQSDLNFDALEKQNTKLLEEAKRQAVPEGLRKISSEKLPPEFQKVLYDNLWELYESAAPQPERKD